MTATKELDSAQVSNGGKASIEYSNPYTATVKIRGIAPLLFHAWNIEAVEEKANAPKGSRAKKTDDVESYVYRTDKGWLGVPGRCLHGALIEAGRFHQDPRSPRKMARDLIRAAIIPITLVAHFEPKRKKWDYEDRQRVSIQRASITRTRPAMKEGWELSFDLLITLPEYITPEFLAVLVTDAGRLAGLCDFRPTYGRFALVGLTTR